MNFSAANVAASPVLVVITAYDSSCSSPLSLKAGASVHIGRYYTGSETWENWVYCTPTDGSAAGWVPRSYVDDDGLLLVDYCAHELTVQVEERLFFIKEQGGWYYCGKENTKEVGWVPKTCVAARPT
ncbi:hypothetical protein A374_16488 [Fictibacillus macauensis ZFHKF-1]|uniref:SH3 domain-containing protein n=1 Tax=Fictibacillus macauensis ZFHKF-1 TaxID=1196324 RepID=I8AFR3_9BACL|nr:SH3 domain-containing protein [Fictibacillus macauensis]EIT84219.1 hypothetical protein A374_16488 [Fictibacillus macauensis ZFHKF-1]